MISVMIGWLLLWKASHFLSLPLRIVDASDTERIVNRTVSNNTHDGNAMNIAAAAAAAAANRQKPFLLGVMVDAGKHEFSTDWILSFMGKIHKIGFNTLHLTLANDQRFAFSIHANATTDKVSQTIDGSLDLRALADHANSLNISLLPEVPLLFSGASWASINNSLQKDDAAALAPLPCPFYICSEQRGLAISGTNLPLDIRHPRIDGVLRNVLRSLVEDLHHPSQLHLGAFGSTSIHIHHGCWKEVLEASDQEPPDYKDFETTLAGIVANDLGYKPRIIRSWEGGGDKVNLDKAGNSTFWQYQDHQRATTTVTGQSYLLQPKELNLATRLLKDHPTGWSVYQQTLEVLHIHKTNYREGSLEGMVVSTEALPPLWFEERNAIGRLLAISMAVQDFEASIYKKETGKERDINMTGNFHSDATSFETAYRLLCDELFPAQTFCNRLGGLYTDPSSLASVGNIKDPNARKLFNQQDKKERNYKKEYSAMWQGWAKDICHRLTETKDEFHLQTPAANIVKRIRETAYSSYWRDPGIGSGSTKQGMQFSVEKEDTLKKIFGRSKIPFRGFIVDLVEDLTPPEVLEELMEQIMVPLGLNTLQLSLINELGCSLEPESLEGLYHIVPKPSNATIKPLIETILQQIVAKGERLGIELIPEISVTTQAMGWYHAGFLVDCPNTMCSALSGGGLAGVANDVNHGSLLPLVLEVVRKLRTIFRSGSFLHLGSDERSSSETCWKESGRTPDYDRFERILSSLLEAKGWYNSSSILRWENKEGIVYPERTGRITQYRYGIHPSTISGQDTSMSAAEVNHVFGSISIAPEKDPWTVYQETRQWITNGDHPPRGLIARIRLNKNLSTANQYKAGILAFAIGLSSKAPVLKDPSSLTAYMSDTICADGNHSHLCPSPSDKGGAKIQSIVSPREQMLCKAMTHTVSRPVMRSQPLVLPSLHDDGSNNTSK